MTVKFVHTAKCQELAQELLKAKQRAEYWCKLASTIQAEYEDKLSALQQKVWVLESGPKHAKKDTKE